MTDFSDFWQTILRSFLGTLLAVGIFYFEGLRERKKGKKDKKDLSESTLEYFNTLLNSSLKIAKKQSESFVKHSLNISNCPSRQNLLEIEIAENLNRLINKLDHSLVFQSFISFHGGKKEQIVLFQKLYNHLDFIFNIYNQALNTQTIYLNKQNDSLHNYKELVEDQVMHLCINLINYCKMSSDVNYRLLGTIIEKSFSEYYNNLINPVSIQNLHINFLEIIREELLKNWRHIPQCFEILQTCRKATWVYNDIIFQSNNISVVFEKYSVDMSESCKEIKELMIKTEIPIEQ